MRILYVLPFTPWPIKVRSYNLIPRLAGRHQIDLVCLARTPAEHDRLTALRPFCSSIRTGTYGAAGALARGILSVPTRKPLRIAWVASASMQEQVREAIGSNRPDVIYVERWRALQYVPKDCDIPVVCDPTDSMALYNARLMRTGRWWERPLGWVEYRKFRSYEPKMANRATATVFCSTVDMGALNTDAVRTRLVKIVNGVNVDSFRPKTPAQEQENTIFFSGNFAYAPNRSAAGWFLKEIFPLIRKEVPDARFLVVGNAARQFIESIHPGENGIEVHDFVPELQPYLASASVAIAPILLGAGVSNKIMEAFSVGTAVVATSMACGDLPVKDGVHLFVANDPVSFASRVVTLLCNQSVRQKMTQSAQMLVREQFDWGIVSANMERVLLEAAGSTVGELQPTPI